MLSTAGRTAAESLMTSTCTVREPGTVTTDPTTGTVTTVPGAAVYAGKCRIRPAQIWGRTAYIAGVEVTPNTYMVSVPFAVQGIRRGHLVTINSCPDADAVGRVWYVKYTPDLGDNVTARRLLCEEQSP